MAIPLGAFLALVLLLVTPVVVLISSAVLFAARRLGGTGFGTLLWGAIALAIHSALLGVKFPGNFYSTLGGYSGRLLDLLDGLASQAYSSMYLVEIAGRVLATPIVVAFAALTVIAAILLRFDCKRVSVPVSWTASALASGTVAVYALAQTYEWATDPALRYPGSFEALAGCGLSVALTLRLLCSWADGQPADTGRFNKELLWLLLTGLSWILMTEPAVRAGEASQLSILVYCLSCVFLLTAGAVLIEWIARIPPQAGWLVAALRIAFLLILVVPLGPQLQQLSRLLPVFMTRSVFLPEEALFASLFALCLAALGAFAWLSLLPLGDRRKYKEAKSKALG